jgi:glucose/mannose-6-phosphate isomerase
MMMSKILETYDKSEMHLVYDDWPKLALEAYQSIDRKIEYKNISHLVFVGMGGSGASGEILDGVLSKSDIHVSVVKGYHLPNPVDSGTLVIVASVSGNTEEALTVLNNAVKKNLKVVAFSAGGKMQEYCKKHNVQYQKIKTINSPRATLPILLYSILGLLGNCLGIKKSDILESIQTLEKTSKKISSSNLSDKNPSLLLARWIDRIPIIYYPYGLYAAAIRFKNELQENCKLNATTEDVVEACHNNIVSWERKSSVQPILIRGKDDYVKTKERWEILKAYFNENKIDCREVISVDGSILSKLINLIYVLDYATIYNAVLNKIDPTPVKSIDYVKAKLASSV